jgi:hypothetical protein
MFEAVINSFQSVRETNDNANPRIQIQVSRERVLDGLPMLGHVDGFVITDNGVGFNPVNLDSFCTSDTEYKAEQGGRGVGRFTWLKVFDHAEIDSHYRQGSEMFHVAFMFTTMADEPPEPVRSKQAQPTTTVRLVGMKKPFFDNCPQSLELIGRRLGTVCRSFCLRSARQFA